MSKIALHWIDPDSPANNFPPTKFALDQPDGLLCFGGDLSPERLLSAYERGIFPWYSNGQPIMWWSPSPRCIILPDELKISRSLKKTMRNGGFSFSMDRAFTGVIHACAAPRDDEPGTWITEEMQAAYIYLHELGQAHSAEIWLDGKLVGGLYGVAIGQVFFGESMFSRARDSSKIALACMTHRLKQSGFQLIDCQVSSAHLLTLGAREILRDDFSNRLKRYCDVENQIQLWQTEVMPVRESIKP